MRRCGRSRVSLQPSQKGAWPRPLKRQWQKLEALWTVLHVSPSPRGEVRESHLGLVPQAQPVPPVSSPSASSLPGPELESEPCRCPGTGTPWGGALLSLVPQIVSGPCPPPPPKTRNGLGLRWLGVDPFLGWPGRWNRTGSPSETVGSNRVSWYLRSCRRWPGGTVEPGDILRATRSLRKQDCVCWAGCGQSPKPSCGLGRAEGTLCPKASPAWPGRARASAWLVAWLLWVRLLCVPWGRGGRHFYFLHLDTPQKVARGSSVSAHSGTERVG